MRLGDLDELKKAIEPYRYATDGVFEGISLIIDNAPTVDIRNNGACEDCEYFNRPITSEPCRNCTLAHRSFFKEKEKVKDDRTQGEWIAREDMDYVDENKVVHNHFECNKCRLIHDFIDGHTSQYNFCPNCGAEMRKGGAE